MADGLCEMCGIEARLDSHHVLPRHYGGADEDIIEVCKSCHNQAESKFRSFILTPFGGAGRWQNPAKRVEHTIKYQKKNIKRLHFSPIRFGKGSIEQYVDHNKATDNLYCGSQARKR